MEAQGDVARKRGELLYHVVIVVSLMVYFLQVMLLCIYLKYII
jgi:hypothetical protein